MSAPKKPNLVSVTTINEDGSRYFLHPADVKGPWNISRRFVGILLIAVYVLLPWIPLNGNPAVFLDVENRMFHLFGLTLVPQDLWVMFFAVSGLGFILFFGTSLLGRVWCGWTCPYTVFLDHVYRRIERWIDGDAPARRALANAPWTMGKIFKRVLKHSLYALVAAAIAHVFLSYFVSLERLYGFMKTGPLEHATAFGIVFFLTLVLWFCFGYFREQFCIIMCPYGRLQSALTDDDTVNVGYDYARGLGSLAAANTASNVAPSCTCANCANNASKMGFCVIAPTVDQAYQEAKSYMLGMGVDLDTVDEATRDMFLSAVWWGGSEEIEEWFVKVKDLGLDGVTVSLPANGTLPERIEQLGEVAIKVFGGAN